MQDVASLIPPAAIDDEPDDEPDAWDLDEQDPTFELAKGVQ